MNEECAYVEAIARYGSISRAARSLHISQPGLSQRLRRLETRLGAELFDRSSTPLRLTPAGESFVRYARTAIAAEKDMQREVRSMLQRKRHCLRVGVSTSRAIALLAPAVLSFYETHCGCVLEFYKADDAECLHRLFMEDKIDLAILTPIVPTPSIYDVQPIASERLVMAISAATKVPQLQGAAPGFVGIQRLEGVPFVLSSCGHYADTLVDQFIRDEGVQLDIAMRGCSPELALELVRAGLGATIVPSTILGGCEDLRVFRIAGLEAGCDLNYVRRLDRPPSEEELLFVRIVRDALPTWEP